MPNSAKARLEAPTVNPATAAPMIARLEREDDIVLSVNNVAQRLD